MYATVEAQKPVAPPLRQYSVRHFFVPKGSGYDSHGKPFSQSISLFCLPGQEYRLVDSIYNAANNPKGPLDMYDAAVLCMQLAPYLCTHADRIIQGRDTPSNQQFNPKAFFVRRNTES